MGRQRYGPQAFFDLHKFPEDQRIKIIGDFVLTRPPHETIGVPVDKEPSGAKVKRYAEKLHARYPTLRIEIVEGSPGEFMDLLKVRAPDPALN